MLRSTFILLVCLCFIPSGQGAPAAASAKKPKAPAAVNPWMVKTYRFAGLVDFETKTHGRLVAPQAPAAQASEKEVSEFIKKSNQVMNAYFTKTGYTPPIGSLFVFDPKSYTLVVRTSESFHLLVEEIAEDLSGHRTKILSCSLEILEADASIIRDELKLMAPEADHATSFERLSALADQSKVKRISALTMQTRSGRRVKLSSTTSHQFSTGFSFEQDGDSSTEFDRYENGTTLDLDPVLGEDAKTIDVNFALAHDFASPTERWTRSSAKIANQAVESQVTDLHNVKLNSAVTFLSGQVQLLGIWKPENPANAAEKTDLLQVAFLLIDAVPVGPLENAQLLPWLTTIGEKVIPTPKEAPAEPEGIPKGMKMRLFRMSPETLGLMSSSAADPFAGPTADPLAAGGAIPQSAKSEIRFTTKSTAMEILRSMGANFPEGSSATYDQEHGILVVRNTPENMKMLDDISGDMRKSISKQLSLTAHIVQADGAFIRKLQKESRRVTDHSNVWQSVEEAASKQQATIVRSTWIATRSGQRATAEFGHEIADVTAFPSRTVTDSSHSPKTETNSNNPSPAPNPKPDDQKQPQPQASPSSSVANASIQAPAPPTLEGSHETVRVGTKLEIDPVIGEDGRTIDLNLGLDYDYAMPTNSPATTPASAKTLRTEVNGHDFHRISVNPVTTMETGTWRLIGVWKPHGTAEFDGKDILQALFVKTDIVVNEAKD